MFKLVNSTLYFKGFIINRLPDVTVALLMLHIKLRHQTLQKLHARVSVTGFFLALKRAIVCFDCNTARRVKLGW